jgi:hypothetical protein
VPIMSANSLNRGGRPKGATFTHGNLGRVGGGRPFLPEELHDYVKDRVGACKYPREVWLIDTLPKGPTGNVQKRYINVPTTERTR